MTTRAFVGRLRARDRYPRLPPGQYDIGAGRPVLTAEAAPTHARGDPWREERYVGD